MNIWENTVLTNKGAALQAKLLQGQTLKIKRVTTGTQKVPVVDLRRQTSVTEGGYDLILQPARTEGDRTIIPVLLENRDLKESYELWQVGFYAEDPDEGEILFCLAQASQAKNIPSAAESPGFSITWDFYFNTSNTAPFEVVLDSKGLVNIEQYQIHTDAISEVNEKTDYLSSDVDELNSKVLKVNAELANRYTKSEVENKLNEKISKSSFAAHYVESGNKSIASGAETTVCATFIVPQNGIYSINANSYFGSNSGGTYRQLDILRNNSSQGMMSNSPLNGLGTRVINNKIIPLIKNDKITFILRQNSGTTLTCSVYVNILGIYK